MEAYFNFYGIRLRVSSNSIELIDNIKSDFSYFESSDRIYDINIESYRESLPYYKIPKIRASLYNVDSIAYDDKNVRYVDYHGDALTIYDYESENGEIYSENFDLLYELSYLMINSRVGELLDRNGIHRVHALGFSYKNKAVLCLMPEGGGKTTLALDLLKEKDIMLISEDTPLITKNCEVLPFPSRMGIRKGSYIDIPSEYLREFRRRKNSDKVLIDIEYFREKISSVVEPWITIIGEREFSNESKIEKTNKIKALPVLVKNIVFGLGLPQMVEYFLRYDIKDILDKYGIALSRLFTSLKILSKSKTYRFIIGRDQKKNAKELINFLHDIC